MRDHLRPQSVHAVSQGTVAAAPRDFSIILNFDSGSGGLMTVVAVRPVSASVSRTATTIAGTRCGPDAVRFSDMVTLRVPRRGSYNARPSGRLRPGTLSHAFFHSFLLRPYALVHLPLLLFTASYANGIYQRGRFFSGGSAGRLPAHSRTASLEDAGITADLISTEKGVFSPAPG